MKFHPYPDFAARDASKDAFNQMTGSPGVFTTRASTSRVVLKFLECSLNSYPLTDRIQRDHRDAATQHRERLIPATQSKGKRPSARWTSITRNAARSTAGSWDYARERTRTFAVFRLV